MHIQRYRPARAALAVGALLSGLLAHEARAQSCTTDSECGPGYACLRSPGYDCDWSACWQDAAAVDAGVRPPGANPSDDSGSAEPSSDPAPEQEDGGYVKCEPTCTPTEYRYCGSAPCTTNADCPSNMVCHTETWQECSGGSSACKPGIECEEPDADASYTCVERQGPSSCTLRANLPCRTGSDCGDGYDCIQATSTTCWGGGKVDADGGVTFEDAGSGCTTEPTDYFYCRLQQLPCETDTECPTGLVCRDQYYYDCDAGSPRPPSAGASPDAGAEGGADGGYLPVPCVPVLTRMCQPWYPGSTDAGTGGDIGGIGGGTGGTTDPGPWLDAGTPTSGGGAVGGGSPGGSSGTVGGGGYPSTDAGASADAGAQTPDDDEEEDHPHRGGLLRRVLRAIFGAGGCSTGAAPVHGNLGWVSLLSLALVLRRRSR